MRLKLILTTAIVGTVASLLAAATPAQAAPFVYVTGGKIFQYDIGGGGQLTPLSPPTVGTGAGGIAVSPDGKSTYVATAGNRIAQYNVGADGTLSPKYPATVPAAFSPGGIAVSQDGKSVYVTAISGAPGYQYYVLQYDVGAGGALSPKSPAVVETPEFFEERGIAVSPDSKSVYVGGYLLAPMAHAQPGLVLQYDVDAGGALFPKDPPTVETFTSEGEGGQLAVSPDGQSVYAVNSFVSQYDVGAGGTLSPKSPATVAGAGSGIAATPLAVSPDGKNLYAASWRTPFRPGEVFQYAVGIGGLLTPLAPPALPTGAFPHDVAVSPDGKSVYVTGSSGPPAGHGYVFQYYRGASGVLSPKNPATVAGGGGEIAMTPLARVPTGKDQCKGGGWRSFPQFRNQGQCVAFVERGPGPGEATGAG